MPIALTGRDLLGCAETGSGKTTTFTIPMIQHCLAQPPIRRGDGPLALVLAPARELAQQIEKEIAYFLEPGHDCLVECLPTCKS
ncbi:P-loop containing nucleoside triphosphate hydrolase superfamily protein [Trifolium repens]|nr:P-loop containing nucleoside triphosphate hydrolase superfamily protein [Trifolium repens]